MKQKKLTVNKLAFGNLKARKKQYTLMIIGIVLAMIFSSGVMFFIFCLSSSIQELNDKKIGRQDAILNASQNYDMDYLFESKTVKDHGFAYIIGYGYTDEKSPEQGTSVARLDDKAEEISYIKAKEGRMPEKKGEIAIEYDALNRLGLFYSEIGDKITLKFRIADGENYLYEETEKTYTLVGKLWDKRPNIEYNYGDRSFYPSAVVSSEETVDLGGKENILCFLTIKNANLPLDSFMEAAKNAGIEVDGNFDNYNCILTTSNRWYFSEKHDIQSSIILAIILSVVLMIASCTGIVNAFNTNLLERKKQIGMLRAVGATKRQIIKIFGREAFLIAAVTTPVSLAVSYFSVKSIIGAMGDNFVFIPEWWVLIVCGLFGVVCVMAAAFIPLYIASRVSPMQAIRNTELMRKVKNKRIRSKKEFNAPKLIAKRNLVFYRKKQAAVSVILIATIVFTSLGFSLLSYTLKYDMGPHQPGDYHIQNQTGYSRSVNIRSSKGFSENDRQEILSHLYVSDIVGRKEAYVHILTDEYTDYMRVVDYTDSIRFETDGGMFNRSFEEYLNVYGKTEYEFYSNIRKELGYSEHLFPAEISSFELSDFLQGMENAVYEGEINIDKLNSGEEIVLYAPERLGFHRGDDTYGTLDMDKYESGEVLIHGLEDEDIKATAERDYKVGDTIKISTLISNTYPEDDNHLPKDTERYDREVKIAAIITDYSDGSGGFFRGDYLDLVTTLEGFDKIVPDYRYWSFDVNLNAECTPEIDEEMTAFLKSFNAGNDGSGYFHSKFATNKENRKTVAGVLVAILSIAILFFCICASVINNQLTAQIRENKREIGTLRAVGASARELTQSYFRELLSMFGWGCGAGFGLYTVIWFVMYLVDKYIDFGSRYYPYQIWEAILICLLLLAICFINLYSKVKKQMKYSIVENIREL
ncbi:MAG: ABC transporter permease [Clostridia bacterium]|nr:ABC transporter permease [Clostridia bacterium]